MLFNKRAEALIVNYPMVKELVDHKELFWINEHQRIDIDQALNEIEYKLIDIEAADSRLKRFAAYFLSAFKEEPSLIKNNGIIESDLIMLNQMYKGENVYLKLDSHLPISGSIKARGGIYEVLCHGEQLALENGLIKAGDDYSKLNSSEARALFSQYEIVVGSTGNLGMSIGIMGAKLGFVVIVHMSKDAKQWKKELLKSRGVTVVEHSADYSRAVEVGRAESESKEHSYFVDDESSELLFLGYSVAAIRLKKQLEESNVLVDENNPLFVYMPCGVGGAPGGITFGLKSVFKNNVYCFFAEPTHAPCMLLGMYTEAFDGISVQDIGIDNITEADGLAVGKPSGLVAKMMDSLLSGVSTVEDQWLLNKLKAVYETEKIFLEPSALAGFKCYDDITKSEKGKAYLKEHKLDAISGTINHIVWATGGNMVPDAIRLDLLGKAR